MEGKFIPEPEIEMQGLDWGRLGWVSSPVHNGAAQLAIVVGDLNPGKGHSFRKHPGQEEVMYVVSGKVEQWIDKEKRVLGAGDFGLHSTRRGPRFVQRGRHRREGHGDFQPMRRRRI